MEWCERGVNGKWVARGGANVDTLVEEEREEEEGEEEEGEEEEEGGRGVGLAGVSMSSTGSMAPNEHAENSVGRAGECVDLLEKQLSDGIKPQVVRAGYYLPESTTTRRRRYDKALTVTKQVLAAMLASLSSVSIGFITAYSLLTLPQLRNDTSLNFDDARDSGWIASLPSISSIMGSLLGGVMMDTLGPRTSLLVTALPCLLSWCFIAFANSITLIYVGRFITGIFSFFPSSTAEPNIRGLMGAFPEAAVALGPPLCYAFGSVMDWRWLAGMAALVPGVPLFISMLLFPESPQWLTKKAKLQQAEKSLRFFRQKSHNVTAEVDMIYTNITETGGAEISIWEQIKLFRKAQNWKPVLIVFLVFMCGQFSGFAVVTAYTVDIFDEANTNIHSDTATVIVGLVRFGSTLVSAILLDRTGRKPLLIISAIGSSVGMVSIGTFFYLKDVGATEGLGWLPLASLLVYLIPLAVRTIGNGVAVTAYSLFAFIIGLTYPMLTSRIDVYLVFWTYALFSLSGVALGIFLPETRGKTLEEIEKFFAPTKPLVEKPLTKENIA
ncbi:Facilitated trehalose transporter Tret1-like 18 [Homarus americanus]|uniref:Facilitated trehalose transporter Tret1-like 18 n=1 Tax=Homarus americanus TaxID=6706 RepID=A0A8J5MM36_HOMAM|nr:Facilitated trehalose transporter Tret1-like 18 [Homarus americanus]